MLTKTPTVTTDLSAVACDTASITVILPANFAVENEVHVTLTPRSQRIAALNDNTTTIASSVTLTPTNTPRCRVARFELAELATCRATTQGNRSETSLDPFGSHANLVNDKPHDIRIVDISDSEDEESDGPEPIYPSPAGRRELPKSPAAHRGCKFYVVTKGKRIGIFNCSWYVYFLLDSDLAKEIPLVGMKSSILQ